MSEEDQTMNTLATAFNTLAARQVNALAKLLEAKLAKAPNGMIAGQVSVRIGTETASWAGSLRTTEVEGVYELCAPVGMGTPDDDPRVVKGRRSPLANIYFRAEDLLVLWIPIMEDEPSVIASH